MAQISRVPDGPLVIEPRAPYRVRATTIPHTASAFPSLGEAQQSFAGGRAYRGFAA